MEYNVGDATQLAQNYIFEYDSENMLPGFEYLDKMDDLSLFSDSIKMRLAALGHADILNDTKKIVATIISYCNEAGVSLSRQTLSNWIDKSAPIGNKISRENVYKLCFALKMDAFQTGEFFLKAYLERPFNYKNPHEAVYSFCLNTGRSYKKAEDLIHIIESSPIIDKPDAMDITEEIGDAIFKICDEKEFIKLISENRSSYVTQNKTAIDQINKLIKEAMPLAEEEYNRFISSAEKNIIVNSIDDLLNVIYDYSARKTVNYRKVLEGSLKQSNFPKTIKRNFPERQEFVNILNGKASYDVIRKALIMLTFYRFFADIKVKEIKPYDLFDQFVMEMDTILMECGYVQLYWRNPYDWMIGYCAYTDAPLDTLREFIYEFYLSRIE